MLRKQPWAAALALAAALLTSLAGAQDEAGFVSLFDGKSLAGWDGDPRLWSVKDGVIRGETTPAKRAAGNTFLVWKGGRLENFVLKLEFRVGSANNSGVQFRSELLPARPGAPNRWVVRGYQAEVQEKPGKVGFLYDERRRGRLVFVGDFVVLDRVAGQLRRTVRKLADRDALIEAGYYRSHATGAWNQYTITCRGNHIMMALNGHQTVELIDNDRAERSLSGLLALQLHAGEPMWVEFRKVRLKRLPEKYGEAVLLFNGRNLDGWTVPFASCRATFGVQDGRLTVTGRPTGYLRTVKDYTNYILRLQIRHLEACNSGVLLRIVGDDRVWPRCIEAQGKTGSLGDLYSLGGFPMQTDPARTRGRRTEKLHPSNERPVGGWNQYEIRLVKGDLELLVNGRLQNVAHGCRETAGKIGLQSEGGPLELRNLVLIPVLR